MVSRLSSSWPVTTMGSSWVTGASACGGAVCAAAEAAALHMNVM
jgi:hypothetical protein